MPKLIGNMVIRNEADRHLHRVLTELKKHVDTIVVTDDCSTDESVKIVKEFTPHVRVLPEPLFVQNEGLLRMTAWGHLSEHASPGDWILAIDADEIFHPTKNFETLLNQTQYPVLGVTFYHMWNPYEYRVDKGWTPNISSRLFRFQEGGVFRKSKLACGSEPTYVVDHVRAGRFLPRTGLRMQHLGYERDADKKAKYERYMTLDQGNFHAIQHIKSIIDPDPVLAQWNP